MSTFQIVMTPDAEADLYGLRSYIADVLGARDTARAYLHAVRKEITSLSEMPGRYKAMDDEPWRSRGVRRVLVKNSFVYYRIDETAGKVYILNVIYARRDQLRALSRRTPDGYASYEK